MNEGVLTSLDGLNDLALPPDVSWWPLAPGWYVVSALLVPILVVIVARLVSRRRAQAYRRAALRALRSIEDVAGIAVLLRRTALAFAPREAIAEKTGAAWLNWLAARCPDPMPDTVREMLTAGVYGRGQAHRETSCESAGGSGVPDSTSLGADSIAGKPSGVASPDAGAIEELRRYAARWIARHQAPLASRPARVC